MTTLLYVLASIGAFSVVCSAFSTVAIVRAYRRGRRARHLGWYRAPDHPSWGRGRPPW